LLGVEKKCVAGAGLAGVFTDDDVDAEKKCVDGFEEAEVEERAVESLLATLVVAERGDGVNDNVEVGGSGFSTFVELGLM
jgi:hypothetical protein